MPSGDLAIVLRLTRARLHAERGIQAVDAVRALRLPSRGDVVERRADRTRDEVAVGCFGGGVLARDTEDMSEAAPARDVDVGPPDDAANDSEPTGGNPSRFKAGLRWVFGRRLCFGGLVVALLAFCVSLTPSLLPRGWLFQGVVSGVSMAVGYGSGSAGSAIIRRFVNDEPDERAKFFAWRGLAVATPLLVALFLWLGNRWQDDLRGLMGMPSLPNYHWVSIVLLSIVLALILLVLARLVRGGTRLLIRFGARFVPPRVAQVGGVVVSLLLLVGLINGVILDGLVSSANSTYSVVNDGTTSLVTPTTSELRSGGPGSLVSWDSLGTRGRDFTGDGGGPTVADIEAFTGEPAIEPIRAYVGLESADSVAERAELAVAELERTGAFERSVLVIVTVTGTGWVNENAASTIEFMHGGDTAQVAMQYSYLPSWISFLVDNEKAGDAAEALIDSVTARVAELPEDARPSVLVYGESLGSSGTESAFDGVDDLLTRTDGALLVGPTFNNTIHNDVRDRRDEDSPFWRPVFDSGANVRQAVDPSDLDDASLYSVSEWRAPRVVYLQNSSDPIGYFSFDLFWNPPEWLRGERGPDVSDSMIWIPVVTFAQVASDLANGSSAPAGHGHLYGANVVDGWAGVLPPVGWTDEDTQNLRSLIELLETERQARAPDSS
ncbi:MAG: alpha/beta hydrolase [Ilumatobacteraceae bacterium]